MWARAPPHAALSAHRRLLRSFVSCRRRCIPTATSSPAPGPRAAHRPEARGALQVLQPHLRGPGRPAGAAGGLALRPRSLPPPLPADQPPPPPRPGGADRPARAYPPAAAARGGLREQRRGLRRGARRRLSLPLQSPHSASQHWVFLTPPGRGRGGRADRREGEGARGEPEEEPGHRAAAADEGGAKLSFLFCGMPVRLLSCSRLPSAAAPRFGPAQEMAAEAAVLREVCKGCSDSWVGDS